MTGLIITGAIVLLLALILVTAYNRLVRLRNNRENAFAD
ncbi:MAG: LemA family protein, partial [Bacteroidales bacterium]